MLEVIVLGQIPGTTIQITFFQVSVFALTSALFLLLTKDIRRHIKIKEYNQNVNDIAL